MYPNENKIDSIGNLKKICTVWSIFWSRRLSGECGHRGQPSQYGCPLHYFNYIINLLLTLQYNLRLLQSCKHGQT